ncbi:MAG: hypothetical protein ACI4WR_02880, partial [Bulleidia sp.]
MMKIRERAILLLAESAAFSPPEDQSYLSRFSETGYETILALRCQKAIKEYFPLLIRMNDRN